MKKDASQSKKTQPVASALAEGFRVRLKQVLGDASVRDFSRRAGVSEAAMRDYLSGGTFPSIDRVDALANAANINPGWLVTGDGPMREGGAATKLPDEFVTLPYYPEVQPGAGGGTYAPDHPEATLMAFRRDWVRRELHADPAFLVLLAVRGESMQPTLQPGEIVIVDQSVSRMDVDGIYVLRLADTIVIKRCQRVPRRDGDRTRFMVKITSDNPAYDPYEVEPQDGIFPDIPLIGRAIWCWSGRRL
jgi:phage repressor protein C with HTH and peptisase S24 domain